MELIPNVLVVSKQSVSSLPTTISDSRISSAYVCVNAELSNDMAQISGGQVTTSAGSAVISGTLVGTTDITLYLVNSGLSL